MDTTQASGAGHDAAGRRVTAGGVLDGREVARLAEAMALVGATPGEVVLDVSQVVSMSVGAIRDLQDACQRAAAAGTTVRLVATPGSLASRCAHCVVEVPAPTDRTTTRGTDLSTPIWGMTPAPMAV